MTNYIIKAHGNINEIIKQLNTIQAILGKGATLSDVATLSRYAQTMKIVKNQIETM